MSLAWLLANWKLLAVGVIVAALGVQTLRLSWAENTLVRDKLAQADAVKKAQERAEALSTDLLIEQAKNMAVTERTVIQYVDRIHKAPDDIERSRLGSVGVRDTLGRGNSQAKLYDGVRRSLRLSGCVSSSSHVASMPCFSYPLRISSKSKMTIRDRSPRMKS
jgi:hypothetical protein